MTARVRLGTMAPMASEDPKRDMFKTLLACEQSLTHGGGEAIAKQLGATKEDIEALGMLVSRLQFMTLPRPKPRVKPLPQHPFHAVSEQAAKEWQAKQWGIVRRSLARFDASRKDSVYRTFLLYIRAALTTELNSKDFDQLTANLLGLYHEDSEGAGDFTEEDAAEADRVFEEKARAVERAITSPRRGAREVGISLSVAKILWGPQPFGIKAESLKKAFKRVAQIQGGQLGLPPIAAG